MIDCEDMPVTPIVWNGRLFLFWLKAVKQAQTTPAQFTASSGTHARQPPVGDLNSSVDHRRRERGGEARCVGQAILCWTEYYNGKWQPTKTSDVNLPTTIGSFDQTGPGSFEAIRDSLIMLPAQFTGTSPNLQNYASYDFSIPPDALILPIVIDAISLRNLPTAVSSCTTRIAFQYDSMTYPYLSPIILLVLL